LTERFYEIVRLTRGHTIEIDGDCLCIDLDSASEADLIFNDQALTAAVGPDTFFWVSGGGSILLNQRWLLLVQRSRESAINPGVFSLFTGRSDNSDERVSPRRLVRELFEELLLFAEGERLTLRNTEYQPAIDSAQGHLRSAGFAQVNAAQELLLTEVQLPTARLQLISSGNCVEHRLAWHIGSRNDINVLFLFGGVCNLDGLTAEDGERDSAPMGILGQKRRIVLYDLMTGNAVPISDNDRSPIFVSPDMMSEHLKSLLRMARFAGYPR
jgi:hypothetical protein